MDYELQFLLEHFFFPCFQLILTNIRNLYLHLVQLSTPQDASHDQPQLTANFLGHKTLGDYLIQHPVFTEEKRPQKT